MTLSSIVNVVADAICVAVLIIFGPKIPVFWQKFSLAGLGVPPSLYGKNPRSSCWWVSQDILSNEAMHCSGANTKWHCVDILALGCCRWPRNVHNWNQCNFFVCLRSQLPQNRSSLYWPLAICDDYISTSREQRNIAQRCAIHSLVLLMCSLLTSQLQ